MKNRQGFFKAAILKEVKAKDYFLPPSHYVGSEAEEDGIPFGEKMKLWAEELAQQFRVHRLLFLEVKALSGPNLHH